MTSPLITLHAYLPERQAFTFDYNSIFAVSNVKKATPQGTKKSVTLVYLLSMDTVIEVAESRSEVIELWEQKIAEFAEATAELTEDEEDDEDDETQPKEDNNVENENG